MSFVQGYTNLERAGNLLNELSALHEKQDYWDVSKLSALGLSGIAKAPLVEQTPINDVIASYVKLEPKFWVDCHPEAMAAFGSVIKKNSKFPLTYYYRGRCNRANHQERWQEDIENAKAILRIMTSIPGHDTNHDEVLNLIEADNPNAEMPPGMAKNFEP
jgi:hypothetical protein